MDKSLEFAIPRPSEEIRVTEQEQQREKKLIVALCGTAACLLLGLATLLRPLLDRFPTVSVQPDNQARSNVMLPPAEGQQSAPHSTMGVVGQGSGQ